MSLLRVAPFVVFVLHVLWYGSWIVDDAAITFAYARNVAEGHGFVAHRFAEPVEGFTNLGWLLTLLPCFALELFDPVVTPKVVATACVLVAMLLARRIALRIWPGDQPLVDLGLLLVACNPAVATWTASGLENGLFVLLVVIAIDGAIGVALRSNCGWSTAFVAALVCFAITITRPDGLVFCALYPLALLARPDRTRSGSTSFVIFTGTLAALLAILTLWRFWTFGDVVPNTFRVKGSGTIERAVVTLPFVAVITIASWLASRRRGLWSRLVPSAFSLAFILSVPSAKSLCRSLGGDVGMVLLPLAFLCIDWSERGRARWIAIVAVLAAMFEFVVLPTDWMGEYRFGTVFVVWGSLVVTVAIGRRVQLMPSKWRPAVVAVAFSIAAIALFRDFRRASKFRELPVISMQHVQSHFEDTFVRWSRDVGRPCTVAQPDVGGALWSGTLPIVDLGGLCDARIAPLLAAGNRLQIAELVLGEMRPDFVSVHGPWAWTTGIAEHPLLLRDYVAVFEHVDAAYERYSGAPGRTGIYVRHDVLPNVALLAAWRARGR